jgi:hypothetical protein
MAPQAAMGMGLRYGPAVFRRRFAHRARGAGLSRKARVVNPR